GFRSFQPGILILKFQDEGNFIAFDFLDQHSDRFANLEYFFGIVHSAPGHFRNMQKSVCAAQIDESAEICHVFNSSVYHIAGMNSFKEFSLLFGFLSYQKLLSVADDSSSSGIEFR